MQLRTLSQPISNFVESNFVTLLFVFFHKNLEKYFLRISSAPLALFFELSQFLCLKSLHWIYSHFEQKIVLFSIVTHLNLKWRHIHNVFFNSDSFDFFPPTCQELILKWWRHLCTTPFQHEWWIWHFRGTV